MDKDEKRLFGELLGRFRLRARPQLSQLRLAEKIGVSRLTVLNWEQGSYLPKTRPMVLDVAKHLALNDQERDELLAAAFFHPQGAEPEPSFWSVPLHRNAYFLGRDDLLEIVHQQLQRGETTALTQPAALSGLGGIGKTQLAVEYAYRYQHEYTSVLWLQAETQESLYTSCNTLAQVLQLPEQSEEEQSKAVAAVQRWFREHTGWLMILDNVEDLHLIQTFLLTGYHGSVLLTTRVRRTNPLAQAVEVRRLPEMEGMLLLLRRAGWLAHTATMEQAIPDEVTAAKALWVRMDGLPLALDQAGAYIHEMECSVQEYLALFDQRQAELLKKRGHWSPDHPASVVTTFTLAYQQICQRNPFAGDLLALCAFLAPNQIPEEIVSRGGVHLGFPVTVTGEVDPLEVRELIGLLSLYSLIERNREAHAFSVHRLVQAVLRDAILAETGKLWMWRVVSVVNTAFPEVDFVHWMACERCVPHAILCATWIEQEQMAVPEAEHLLNQAATYLTARARYTEAEPLYQQALAIDMQQIGPGHFRTAISLNNLANLYYHQGKYTQAEMLSQKALAISEQQLGPHHPDTASRLNNLAALYFQQGKYAEAEPLYQRALAIREQQLGPEHPGMAQSLNNLASLYFQQGKYAEAEPLFKHALTVCKQQLGSEHPHTQRTLRNYAFLLRNTGRDTEAGSLEISDERL